MEKYITPEMEIIKFEVEDIITGSTVFSTDGPEYGSIGG